MPNQARGVMKVDCFDKILKIYHNPSSDKFRLLIELVKDLRNPLELRNCLLFFNMLCLNNKEPDYSFNKGKTKERLTQYEKWKMHELLKVEVHII